MTDNDNESPNPTEYDTALPMSLPPPVPAEDGESADTVESLLSEGGTLHEKILEEMSDRAFQELDDLWDGIEFDIKHEITRAVRDAGFDPDEHEEVIKDHAGGWREMVYDNV